THQDRTLQQIQQFLETLELPEFPTPTARSRFLRKCQQYFIKNSCLYRRYPQRMPVRVVFDTLERQRILREAHD
ncbi:hypothetical protein FKP32DRAFT_1538386, partial [Trametes sanguinea]